METVEDERAEDRRGQGRSRTVEDEDELAADLWIPQAYNDSKADDFHKLRKIGTLKRYHLLVLAVYIERIGTGTVVTKKAISDILQSKKTDDLPYPFVDHFLKEIESVRTCIKNFEKKFQRDRQQYEKFRKDGQQLITLYQHCFFKEDGRVVSRSRPGSSVAAGTI